MAGGRRPVKGAVDNHQQCNTAKCTNCTKAVSYEASRAKFFFTQRSYVLIMAGVRRESNLVVAPTVLVPMLHMSPCGGSIFKGLRCYDFFSPKRRAGFVNRVCETAHQWMLATQP